MNFKNIIRQIAKQNGVTSAKVKKDIREAIRIGMDSPNKAVQEHRRKISQAGKEPSIDQVLTYLVYNIK